MMLIRAHSRARSMALSSSCSAPDEVSYVLGTNTQASSRQQLLTRSSLTLYRTSPRIGECAEREAIAKETTHPTNVQPRKMFSTTTEPTFGTCRMTAMIAGMKYKMATKSSAVVIPSMSSSLPDSIGKTLPGPIIAVSAIKGKWGKPSSEESFPAPLCLPAGHPGSAVVGGVSRW